VVRRVRALALLGTGLLVCAALSLVSGSETQGANQSPTANAGPNLNGIVGQAMALDGSGSTDPDGTIARYRWEQVFPSKTSTTYVTSNPVSLSAPASAAAFFTPQWPGNYRFRLTVVDNAGAENSVTVDVPVRFAVNPLPPQGAELLGCGVQFSDNETWRIPLLKRLQGTYAVISPQLCMPSRSANRVEFIDADGNGTISDDDLKRLINLCHDDGISVVLKPMINAPNYSFDRFDMQPTDWNAWFASYQSMIAHYAQVAADAGVELFCIGSENWSTESHTQLWRGVIAAVRAIYHGPITYESCSTRFEGNQWDVKFWDALDYIGVSAFIEGSGTERDPTGRLQDPTLDQMKTNIDRIYSATVGQVAKRYNKKVLFMEAGCNTADWGNCEPAIASIDSLRKELGKTFSVDYGERSTYFEALLEVVASHPEIEGVFWWELEALWGLPMDLSVASEPVATLLSIWYGTAAQ
jgi:hypothetical protein